ncbi:MAG: helix-turn-helix transcriptional regulator [Arenibacterium sp.]
MKSFAHELLGSYAGKAKFGSVWSSNHHLDDGCSRLAQFQERERLGELVVIPLAANKRQLDFLEIHSTQPTSDYQSEEFEEFAISLSDTWQTRKPGVFARALPKAHSFQNRLPKAPPAPIMSFENPAGLSKTEYRVCASLNRGLTTGELCDELQISKATLRTHLRNIYEKTNADSLPQLMYALVSCAPFETDLPRTG